MPDSFWIVLLAIVTLVCVGIYGIVVHREQKRDRDELDRLNEQWQAYLRSRDEPQ